MDQLREWRKAKGITIDEAGALAGVSGVQWHRYETGSRSVSSGKVARVAEITGIPPQDIRPDLAGIFSPPSIAISRSPSLSKERTA